MQSSLQIEESIGEFCSKIGAVEDVATRPNSCCEEQEEETGFSHSRNIRQYLQCKVVQPELQSRSMAQGISWLQFNSWSSKTEIEGRILAATYFYIYAANRVILNSQLESVLAACLWTASKIARRPELSLQEVLHMVGTASEQEILMREAELARIMDWCLWPDIVLFQEDLTGYSEEEVAKLFFLLEVLLLTNSEPLFSQQLMRRVAMGAKMNQLSPDCLQPKKILSKRAGRLIIQIYQSKFDVGQYLQVLSGGH